jgi:hypothetical protein
MPFMAATARTDITPPIGIAHAGWGAQTHQRAAGVDLPLWATALALSDGDETVVIVDLDFLLLWEPQAQTALEAICTLTGLPPSHVRLAYTHTHSGSVSGETWSSWIKDGSEMIAAYDASLPHRLAGIAWNAIQNLRPARVAAGSGTCNINVNRRFQRPEDQAVIVGRNWDGPVDHEVKLIKVDTEDGKPLAAIVNYACHPITVGPDSQLITPDYPGVVRRVVEQSTGATCLFLQGAAGDVGPVRGVAQGGQYEYKRLGAILGHEASRIWWEVETAPRQERYTGTLESGAPLAIYSGEPEAAPAPKLRVATRPMHLPVKQMPAPEAFEAEFREHSEALTRLRESGASDEAIRLETMHAKRAAMRADLARQVYGKTHRTFELQSFTIGDDIALIAMPGEPFCQIGMAIKSQSPYQHTLFSAYSNVGWAYIPTPDAYELGGYEVEITPFSPDASVQIVQESLTLLHQMKG